MRVKIKKKKKILAVVFAAACLAFIGPAFAEAPEVICISAEVIPVSPPESITASAASSSRIDLAWSASATAAAYKIYRNDIYIASTGQLYFYDTGLSASTAYSYKLVAVNSFGGYSNQSDSFSATTNAASAQPAGGGGGGGGGAPLGPPVPYVSIEKGAQFTSSAQVQLDFLADTAQRMTISNTGDFSGSAWETFALTRMWILPSGPGIKVVYFKVKYADGSESAVVSDSITLTGQTAVGVNADVNQDGAINDYDLSIILANWYGGTRLRGTNRLLLDVCLENDVIGGRCIISNYARVEKKSDSVFLINYEDGADWDYNDTVVKVFFKSNSTADITIVSVDASAASAIKFKTYYNNEQRNNGTVWKNASANIGKTLSIDLGTNVSEYRTKAVNPALISDSSSWYGERVLKNPRADINRDLIVDDYDLSILLHNWRVM
jgi:hypothetical protein